MLIKMYNDICIWKKAYLRALDDPLEILRDYKSVESYNKKGCDECKKTDVKKSCFLSLEYVLNKRPKLEW